MIVRSPDIPEAAEGAWAIAFDKRIYIYGGLGDKESVNKIWEYDIGTSEYTEITSGGRFTS